MRLNEFIGCMENLGINSDSKTKLCIVGLGLIFNGTLGRVKSEYGLRKIDSCFKNNDGFIVIWVY